jgi:hypothetical protein
MPRSGTSLMMQMLQAGGITALTDNRHPHDNHNPHGYFEYEPVKRIAQDASWMDAGSARFLHPSATCGDAAAEQPEERVIAAFAVELQETRRWLGEQPNIRTPFVLYADIISDPARWSSELSRFLDGLGVSAMSAVVDPRLRHHGA